MARLALRHFRESDFADFHALVSDFDVVGMLASWPWPPDPEFTRNRMDTPQARAGDVLVIDVDGRFAGSIGGIDGGLGYMLARPFWGQGIATRAVRQMLATGFGEKGWDRARAGCWHDNPASMAVLRKCGFHEVAPSVEYCKARDICLQSRNFELSRRAYDHNRAK